LQRLSYHRKAFYQGLLIRAHGVGLLSAFDAPEKREQVLGAERYEEFPYRWDAKKQ
jgi:hypothetical protein